MSEKSIKFAAANANSCMNKWKFETWNDTGCFQNADGSTNCVENMPVWHAKVCLSLGYRLTTVHQLQLCIVLTLNYLQFRHSLTMGSQDVMMANFEKLTGAYARRRKSVVDWIMSNGTHERRGNLTEAYPPHGHVFWDLCQWMDL